MREKKIENKNYFISSFFKVTILAVLFIFMSSVINGADQNDKFVSLSCETTLPDNVMNNTTFFLECDFLSNISSNHILFKSSNSGKLLNNINSKLTPRPYSASYNITVLGDSLQDTTVDASTSVLTSTYSTVYDIVTSTSPTTKNNTINVTVSALFMIDDNTDSGDDLNGVYLGTYSDTISVKVIEGVSGGGQEQQ